MLRKNFIPLVLALGFFLLSGCGESKEKIEQKTAATDAVKALRKIQAATQVGVNFQQYGQLVIDAKAQVNEATAKLPDGELKKEIIAAMEAYTDAAQVWNYKIQDHFFLTLDSEPGKTLIPKYGLKVDGNIFLLRDNAEQPMWAEANKHLERAASLLEK